MTRISDRPVRRDAAPSGGIQYQSALIDTTTEARMLEQIAALPFREFEFHRYTARRRVISFGWQYDFGVERMPRVDEMPG
jgi:hypothetical protein